MARLTKEEKAQQVELQRIAAEHAEAAFRKELPKKLYQLVEAAKAEYITVDLTLTENGPRVAFQLKSWELDVLDYSSPQWEVEDVERQISALKSERLAAAAKLELAKSAFSKLTEDEQEALRDCINQL